MHKNDLKAYFTEETVGELLAWYRVNRRALPWRETTDPYRIWLSEIMLQQTRVEAVKPYYACFLEAAPTVLSLKNEKRLLLFFNALINGIT
jgi:adenine-specific DNA glycosylase